MCGRYTLTTRPNNLLDRLGVKEVRIDFEPRYNIAPGQSALVVQGDRAGGKILQNMRWGLVPSWADDPGTGYRLINARGETADSEAPFQGPFRYRRCLVPADGFFKVVQDDNGGTQPYWIHRPDRSVFLMVGLWDEWSSNESQGVLLSFTIVTIPTPDPDRRGYDRIPVVLDEKACETWMRPGVGTEELRRLLLSAPATDFRARQVSRHMLDPATEGPVCIEPVAVE